MAITVGVGYRFQAVPANQPAADVAAHEATQRDAEHGGSDSQRGCALDTETFERRPECERRRGAAGKRNRTADDPQQWIEAHGDRSRDADDVLQHGADRGHGEEAKGIGSATADEIHARAHTDGREEADHQDVAEHQIHFEVHPAVAQDQTRYGVDQPAGDRGGDVQTVEDRNDSVQPAPQHHTEGGYRQDLNCVQFDIDHLRGPPASRVRRRASVPLPSCG